MAHGIKSKEDNKPSTSSTANKLSAHTNITDVYQRLKWNGWGTRGQVMDVSETNPRMVLHANGKKMPSLMKFAQTQLNAKLSSEEVERMQKATGSQMNIVENESNFSLTNIFNIIMGKQSSKFVPLETTPSITLENAIAKLPPANINEAFLDGLVSSHQLQEHQIKTDGEARICHIVGKNYRDLWRVRNGFFDRAPDVVILPQSHDDVVAIMQAAMKHNVVLVPFGGGTNVTGGIEASPFERKRMVVSVDLRRMNKLLKIDIESRVASIECGVLGPDLDEAINKHGFLLGHDPDSYIHSTLGGWIAARSSGAYSNTYGDIEDMVLSMKVVTPTGVIKTPLASRPCGPDLNALFIGSEGHFGIITEATVKISPIPPCRHYEGWFFPDFESGYNAFYECTKKGIRPTCMRLYDEDDTTMSFALKTEGSKIADYLSKVGKMFMKKVKGWNISIMCFCVVGHEGTADRVRFERLCTNRIFSSYGGICIGKAGGANWQEKKYDLPYVRDFALQHKLWADVFETSVLYTDALVCWREVKQAVLDVWKEEGKQGWIGCHCAHQYQFGCCLYFTFAGQQVSERDMELFLKIKIRSTEVMLRYSGNLAHHHGIGYEHVPWIERYMGTTGMDLLLAIKRTLDPIDICNPHKLLPVQKKKFASLMGSAGLGKVAGRGGVAVAAGGNACNRNAGETDEQLEERRKKMMMFFYCGLPKDKDHANTTGRESGYKGAGHKHDKSGMIIDGNKTADIVDAKL